MKSKTKAIGVLLAVFLLGGATGAATTFAIARQQDAELYGSESLDHLDQRRLRAMTRRLDLTEPQTEQVREILERHRHERQRMRSELRQTCLKPLDDLRDQLDEEIAAILTEEQRQELARIKDRRSHRRHRRHRGDRR